MSWYHSVLGLAEAEPPKALTASAAPVKAAQSQFLQHTQEWQHEVWRYYDTLGELNTGVTWLAAMMSRVRLRAAVMDPSLDEPTIDNTGLAADIMNVLAGGTTGQGQMMSNLTLQLKLPGDCYLIAQEDPNTPGAELYTVRSVDEVRAMNGRYQTVTDRVPNIVWSDLPPGALPMRIWHSHARYFHLADSPSRSALPIMRELELVNRHIASQYLSRLASAGLLVLPNELTFPVREEFADADDPFTEEFVTIAAEAIAKPGTASGVIPIPIRVPAEVVDKIRFIDFTLQLDQDIIAKRDSAITRLANKLDIPAEVMTGMANVNHWTAWQLDEGALKTHIAPFTEELCDALTKSYLRPRMKASGATDEQIAAAVVWYDMSELAMRPDKSENAQSAYDRMELSGAALRREGGFDEDDAPTDDDLRQQALKMIARTQDSNAIAALNELIGSEVIPVPEPTPPDTGSPTGEEAPESEPPAGPDGKQPPGPPNGGETPTGAAARVRQVQEARALRVMEQIAALHLVKFALDTRPQILHPPVCHDHAYTCPYVHAAQTSRVPKLSTGRYECRLDTAGRLTVGRPAASVPIKGWVSTPLPEGRVNGHAR